MCRTRAPCWPCLPQPLCSAWPCGRGRFPPPRGGGPPALIHSSPGTSSALEWLCCLRDTEHTRRGTFSVARTLGPHHTLTVRGHGSTHIHCGLWSFHWTHTFGHLCTHPVHPAGALCTHPGIASYALTPAIAYHGTLNSTVLPDYNTRSHPDLACLCLFTPAHHGDPQVLPDPGVGWHNCAHAPCHTLSVS